MVVDLIVGAGLDVDRARLSGCSSNRVIMMLPPLSAICRLYGPSISCGKVLV